MVVQAFPEGALLLSECRVTAVGPPLVHGAFQLFEVTVQLAAHNTPCNISVPAGAFTGGVLASLAHHPPTPCCSDAQASRCLPPICQLPTACATLPPRLPLQARRGSPAQPATHSSWFGTRRRRRWGAAAGGALHAACPTCRPRMRPPLQTP